MAEERTITWWRLVGARLRQPAFVVAVALVIGPTVLRAVGVEVASPSTVWFAVALAAALVPTVVSAFAVGGEPVRLAAPVTGRWLAANSPATKVPSHGTLGYGQSHAIDLVADPEDGSRPIGGSGLGLRRPEDYPAFGAPVHAPCDGVVVTASDWRRDHRSRVAWPALVLLVVEGLVRELAGPGWVIGNHVVIRRGDGVHVLLAHLRRGSLRASVGDRVSSRDVVGACGNSGNSTEPHLHVQVMDVRRPSLAVGLPMRFDDVTVEGDAVSGVPEDGAWLHATPTLGGRPSSRSDPCR